ncbi:hypothetical protein N865_09235 [Intrasporangium oryzae NRRL B-24470]|uniref:Uncharacterized protein n=1 Tax=Intrasporangium oryzae NRRL B-24470 TaxID=1386089 RepID=W9GC98_9MICO|nr:hypothetical protein N865_09235 [Intrasporangium oryzae NRRL B-24470]
MVGAFDAALDGGFAAALMDTASPADCAESLTVVPDGRGDFAAAFSVARCGVLLRAFRPADAESGPAVLSTGSTGVSAGVVSSGGVSRAMSCSLPTELIAP